MLRAFQWDLARQVERLDWLLAQLPRYAEWGYHELYLHLEDSVTYPSLPEVARADAYSRRDFEKLIAAATRAGIKVVPIVNLLGHTQYLIKTPALRDLNELRAPDGSPLERGQICPLHPRTLKIAEKLLRDMAPYCTAGKVHLGLDESFHLGQCPRCRAEVARIGLAGHFAAHTARLHALTEQLGLRAGLWADMLALLPEAIPLLPRGVAAYDWYYYPFDRRPRMELRNFADYELAPALRAQGIEYWGCPMNGSFRHEPLPVFAERLGNIVSWWNRCQSTNSAGLLITSWEPSRLAQEMTTLVDAAAASLWLDGDTDDATELLARGFRRAFGLGRVTAHTAARAALRCDEHAFAGYARWEINARWDGCASPQENATRPARAARLFSRLGQAGLPAPLTTSAEFSRYLALRDAFVRQGARAVQRLRRLASTGQPLAPLITRLLTDTREFTRQLRLGDKAARAMWRQTRDPLTVSPNETILAADSTRVRAWRQWLTRVRRRPDAVWEPSVFHGRWQLSFTIHNFAPALQKIIVEQQVSADIWREVGGRFAIEFRAAAARPHTSIRHEFSVPVDAATTPLRIAVRGLGQIGIENITLSDGLTILRPRGPRRFKLGHSAPPRGWPVLLLSQNTGQRRLIFPEAKRVRISGDI